MICVPLRATANREVPSWSLPASAGAARWRRRPSSRAGSARAEGGDNGNRPARSTRRPSPSNGAATSADQGHHPGAPPEDPLEFQVGNLKGTLRRVSGRYRRRCPWIASNSENRSGRAGTLTTTYPPGRASSPSRPTAVAVIVEMLDHVEGKHGVVAPDFSSGGKGLVRSTSTRCLPGRSSRSRALREMSAPVARYPAHSRASSVVPQPHPTSSTRAGGEIPRRPSSFLRQPRSRLPPGVAVDERAQLDQDILRHVVIGHALGPAVDHVWISWLVSIVSGRRTAVRHSGPHRAIFAQMYIGLRFDSRKISRMYSPSTPMPDQLDRGNEQDRGHDAGPAAGGRMGWPARRMSTQMVTRPASECGRDSHVGREP